MKIPVNTPDDPAPAAASAPTAQAPAEGPTEAELLERLQRARAELDNFRKRTAAEKPGLVTKGKAKVVEALLPAFDDLERALAAIRATSDVEVVKDGVEHICRQLLRSLGGVGVELIDPVGEPFDPTQHEAIATQPAGEVPADHVMAVMQKGYRLGDKLIRPARVVVAL